jgi:hypothetical protein
MTVRAGWARLWGLLAVLTTATAPGLTEVLLLCNIYSYEVYDDFVGELCHAGRNHLAHCATS